ncbi:MAG: hypothetical protein ACYCQI_02120 [Gammaproteobacteria bacterium]
MWKQKITAGLKKFIKKPIAETSKDIANFYSADFLVDITKGVPGTVGRTTRRAIAHALADQDDLPSNHIIKRGFISGGVNSKDIGLAKLTRNNSLRVLNVAKWPLIVMGVLKGLIANGLIDCLDRPKPPLYKSSAIAQFFKGLFGVIFDVATLPALLLSKIGGGLIDLMILDRICDLYHWRKPSFLLSGDEVTAIEMAYFPDQLADVKEVQATPAPHSNPAHAVEREPARPSLQRAPSARRVHDALAAEENISRIQHGEPAVIPPFTPSSSSAAEQKAKRVNVIKPTDQDGTRNPLSIERLKKQVHFRHTLPMVPSSGIQPEIPGIVVSELQDEDETASVRRHRTANF